jgi:hypothetical protein
LLGRIGTQLNGRPVSWARLADGDEIVIGPYRIRVHYRAETGSADQRLPALPEMSLPPGNATEKNLLPVSMPAVSGSEAQLLLPVMQQFNVMQQQLCDQFQQTTLMMFRMFTAMHQEQAALIREEMQQIQRVTGELQALQQQVQGGKMSERKVSLPRQTQLRTAAPSSLARVVPAPDVLSTQKQPASATGRAAAPTAPLPQPTADPAAPLAASPAEVDAWLNQRIGELQAERQSRWQRVLSFLSGQ